MNYEFKSNIKVRLSFNSGVHFPGVSFPSLKEG